MMQLALGRQGFSVAELLIAMTLGLLLVAVILPIYRLAKQNYALQAAEAEIQTHANLAINILGSQLRMAGFIGCTKPSQLKHSFEFGKQHNELWGSRGSKVGWQPALPQKLNELKPKTDVISFWSRAAQAYPVEQQADGNFKNKAIFNSGDTLLIASCEDAEILSVLCQRGDGLHCTKSDLTISKPKYRYQQAELAKFQYDIYYLRRSKWQVHASKNSYGLFHKSLLKLHAPAQELVEGIEDMKISYASKDPSRFVPASQVTHWQSIRMVKIALLLVSNTQISAKPIPYHFNDKWYLADDRFLHREWVAYVYLRER